MQGEQWMFSKTLHIAGLPRPPGTCLQSAVIITYPCAMAPDGAAGSKPDPRKEAVPLKLCCLEVRPLQRLALKGEPPPGGPAAGEDRPGVI